MELLRIASFNADSKCPDCCGNKTAVAPFKIMCRHATPFFLSPTLTFDHDLACGDIFEAFDMFGRDAVDVVDANDSVAMLYNVRSAFAPSVAVPNARCFDDSETDEEEEDESDEAVEVAICSNVNIDKSSSSSFFAKLRM